MGTVLVADDDLQVAAALRDALQLDGHDATIAVSGAEAHELLKRQPFDVVVTDFKMPEGGGMYVSGLTRMYQGHNDIIVVSGYLTPSLAGRARRNALANLGVRRFLSKPVEPGELRDAVRELLNSKPRAASRRREDTGQSVGR